jgi:hypothetical protein
MSALHVVRYSASDLRRELSYRGRLWAKAHPHEQSFGSVPSFIFQDCDGMHGNFHAMSYSAIRADAEWALRLGKAYTAGKWIPRRWEKTRCELDCANSSDALLMNIFCYPGVLDRAEVCSLLGVDRGLRPLFGFKPRTPVVNQGTGGFGVDQTEIDMSLGPLLVEAKLTETGFQAAPIKRVMRYRDFNEVFDIDELIVVKDSVQSYQLIRGVLAAHFLDRSFVVFCDVRRRDLVEKWFQIMRAVRHCDLRHRLALLSWQELAAALPGELQAFLKTKYGILQN